jgi:hypothetical protein
MVRARCPFDPVVAEPLLLGFFELRGNLVDAKVVGFLVRQPLSQFSNRS